jgi:hypothetical protein
MTEIADQISGETRVCPQCGTAAGIADVCTGCGLHLAALAELPTQREWRTAAGGGRHSAARRAADGARLATAWTKLGSWGEARSAPSISPLLHPTEPSRLVVAFVASLVGLALPVFIIVSAGIGPAVEFVIALVIFIALLWFSAQMLRARLLGRSVRVDKDTFPELQSIVEEVRETLHYYRPLEVYVTDSAKPSISMTSLLGTRIIVIEGSLLADLMGPGKRAQLVFLVGRCVGALRAKLTRLDLVVQILQWADVLKYVSPFITPYYRATAYSGDQIGMVCCGDLLASLEATRRLLVGGEMAGRLNPGAVLPQAMLVQRRVLPRLAQLFSAEPHTTNRYANLLCFGRYHDPELWQEIYGGMDDREAGYLEGIWRRSPYSHRVDGAGGLAKG